MLVSSFQPKLANWTSSTEKSPPISAKSLCMIIFGHGSKRKSPTRYVFTEIGQSFLIMYIVKLLFIKILIRISHIFPQALDYFSNFSRNSLDIPPRRFCSHELYRFHVKPGVNKTLRTGTSSGNSTPVHSRNNSNK